MNYIEGKLNVLADVFSRLPRFDGEGFVQKSDVPKPLPSSDQYLHILDEAFCHSLYAVDEENIYDESFMYDNCFANVNDKELIECLQWYTSSPELDSYVSPDCRTNLR